MALLIALQSKGDFIEIQEKLKGRQQPSNDRLLISEIGMTAITLNSRHKGFEFQRFVLAEVSTKVSYYADHD